MSYPGPPSSLGNVVVRQEGSCNLIQKVLDPREADSMQTEPKQTGMEVTLVSTSLLLILSAYHGSEPL